MSGWSVLNAASNETNRRITEKGLALRRNLCPKCSILGYLEKTGSAQETNHRIAFLRCHDHKSQVRTEGDRRKLRECGNETSPLILLEKPEQSE